LEAAGKVFACWQECFSLFFTHSITRAGTFILPSKLHFASTSAGSSRGIGGRGDGMKRGKKETENEIFSILSLVQYQKEPRNNNLAEKLIMIYKDAMREMSRMALENVTSAK
jgi:hypothetical protein